MSFMVNLKPSGGISVDDPHTWTAEQTFDGNIRIPYNDRIKFGSGEAMYISSPNVQNLYLICDGFSNLILSRTEHKFKVGNVSNLFRISSTLNRFLKKVQFSDALELGEIATPGVTANYSYLYGKNVAGINEVHVEDEDTNETQISPHRLKEWVYRSRNIKSLEDIQIQMEKFMREHYPEYIVENTMQIKEKLSMLPNGGYELKKEFKWYQIFKKRKQKKMVILSK